MRYVPAATDVRNVRWSVKSAAKNVKTAQMEVYAANAEYASTVSAARATTVTAAISVSIAWELFAEAAPADAPNVPKCVRNATINA